MKYVIRCDGLKKDYFVKGKKVVGLADCTCSIPEGSGTGFVGLNGAGKSTTIKLLTGIMRPDAGTVEVLGKDPLRNRREVARQIGVLFGQRSNLVYDLPVKESFHLLKSIYRLDRAFYERQLSYIGEYIEIGELMDTPVRQMSLGQRMRCEVAAVLLHDPKVVFWDEAFLGIDFRSKRMIQKLVQTMRREKKTTFFITSHDLSDIERMCDDLIVINKGTVIHHDTLDSFIRRSKYVKAKIVFADEINRADLDPHVAIEEYNAEENYVICKIKRDDCRDTLNRLSAINMVEEYSIQDCALEDVIDELAQG